MYFKNEIKYSKQSDHVTDDVSPSFGNANFLCCVMKR